MGGKDRPPRRTSRTDVGPWDLVGIRRPLGSGSRLLCDTDVFHIYYVIRARVVVHKIYDCIGSCDPEWVLHNIHVASELRGDPRACRSHAASKPR